MRAVWLPAALAALLQTTVDPASVAAAPQESERQIRREVVVLGAQPHRRVVFDRLADRGFLGVQLLGLTPELRRHFGAPEESGVMVSRVTPEGPAATAGVRVGDVITTVDGEPVGSTSQLVGRVGRRRQGDEVELELVRERAVRTVRATLAQSERRQIEVGQFLWQLTGDEPLALDLDPEFEIEHLVAVDPKAISESVGELLQRLERSGFGHDPGRLGEERRQQLERRIEELESRLLQMERLLRRHPEPEE